jgi:fumarate reductase subunit C
MAGKSSIFKQVGVLRVIWGVIVILCVLMVFFADGDDAGWHVIPVYVAPVVVVLNIWGLFLDLLISWLFMKQKQAQERLSYRNIMVWDGLMLVLLFAFWGPFFASMFAGS